MLKGLYKFPCQHKRLDFKEVMIIPKRSQIISRKDVSLKRTFTFKTKEKNISWTGVPIISSNMDTVSDLNTFNVLLNHDYITCFPKHFNKTWNETLNYPLRLLSNTDHYMISTGINKHDVSETVKILNNLSYDQIKVKFLCIDVANGYLKQMHDVCHSFRNMYPDLVIVAGNVVTPEVVYDLIKCYGVNIVKVGIGSGMACETRIKTGVGYPQLAAVMECSIAARESGGYIISDGGITNPCDFSKAFAGGADFVMAGGIFAGHDESPGEIIEVDNKKYKSFYGMSSKEANNRYNGGLKDYRTSEGRHLKIPLKGPLENTIKDINGGIRSACTYVGAKDLVEFYNSTQFVKV